MLFTSLKDLTALYPSHKWTQRDFPQLQSLIAEEEESLLLPILGASLYDLLIDDNTTINIEEGSTHITPDTATEGTPAITTRIINACKRAAFYRMLANNMGLLSVSFNPGGGLNQLTTDSYDQADSKSLQLFERDAFNKSKRAIDMLITLLEQDARSPKPLYRDLWRESEYYYEHTDCLFTTIHELKPYIPVSGYDEFMNLLPDIRNVQQNYAAARLGSPIIRALLNRKYTSPSASAPGAEDQSTEGTAAPESPDTTAHWHELRRLTLTAIAERVKSHIKQYTNADTKEYADTALASAKDYLDTHLDIFLPEEYAKLHPAEDTVPAEESNNPKPKCNNHKTHHHTPGGPNSAVFDMMGGLYSN